MRDNIGNQVMSVVTLAIVGAITLLAVYIFYEYKTTGDISLKWYDFTEPGSAIEITVSNLLLTGALSGLIAGGIGRLLGIRLTNRIGIAVALGIIGAVIVALLFSFLISASAYEHVVPGG